MSDARHQMSDVIYQISDARHQMSDVRCYLSDVKLTLHGFFVITHTNVTDIRSALSVAVTVSLGLEKIIYIILI